ncbi:hypothetical protein GCM10027294_33010 [Marinactinospora endophytica]
MSLLLMVMALLGALVVLGAGAGVTAWARMALGERRTGNARTVEGGGEPSAPVAPSEERREEATAQDPIPADAEAPTGPNASFAGEDPHGSLVPDAPPLPDLPFERVRELIALGREDDAVAVVREATGMDLHRARQTVDRVRAGEGR